jgi:hypothetical protein
MTGSKPLRLDEELVRAASTAGRLHRRSVPRQIEFWAEIGRAVEQRLSVEDLIAVREGLARLAVDRGVSLPADPAAVLRDIEAARASGTLAERVSEAPVRYQSCPGRPGLIQRIAADGTREVGRFQGGEFHPAEP